MDARRILLESDEGLKHLATTTCIDPTPEELQDRIQDIKVYLESYFPVIRLVDEDNFYAMTSNPKTLPRERPLPDIYTIPWFARSIDERKTLRQEICINFRLFSLFLRSIEYDPQRCVLRFFMHVVIVHELAHVIVFTFASYPTPVKTMHQGIQEPSCSPSDAAMSGSGWHLVRPGESGASLEVAMLGGDVNIAMPPQKDFSNVLLSDVCVVVAWASDDEESCCKVLRTAGSYMQAIADGDWGLINDLHPSPFPSLLQPAKTRFSRASESEPVSVPDLEPVLGLVPDHECGNPMVYNARC